MRLLSVISRLLDYPSDQLWQHGDELMAEVRSAANLIPESAPVLQRFIETMMALQPMEAQERYATLFDRGRSLSLLLFEHVHGESRDRGQAMVDLMGQYQRYGFDISVRELPDYIPLFLEFLAHRPRVDVQDWLTDAGHIFALLAARLRERGSDYAILLESLLEIAEVKEDWQRLAETVQGEARDDTPEAMDKVWEEETMTFIGQKAANCGGNSATAKDGVAPVRWVAGH